MADDLLADASACLALLRRELDGAQLQMSEEASYTPQAITLLSRMVYLCEAAVDLAGTERKSAAAVLVRPAIKCWINCCYILYCKWEAVLRLRSLGVPPAPRSSHGSGLEQRRCSHSPSNSSNSAKSSPSN